MTWPWLLCQSQLLGGTIWDGWLASAQQTPLPPHCWVGAALILSWGAAPSHKLLIRPTRPYLPLTVGGQVSQTRPTVGIGDPSPLEPRWTCRSRPVIGESWCRPHGPHCAFWSRGSLQTLSLSRLVQAGSLGFPSVLSATLPVLDMQLPCLYESELVSVLATPEIHKKTSSEGGLVSRWRFMEVSVRWDCPQSRP